MDKNDNDDNNNNNNNNNNSNNNNSNNNNNNSNNNKKLQCLWQVQKSYLVKAFYAPSTGLFCFRPTSGCLFVLWFPQPWKKISFTIDPNATMARKLQCKVVWEYSREPKLNGNNLIQTLIGPDPGEVFKGGICSRSEGSFSTSIFTQ